MMIQTRGGCQSVHIKGNVTMTPIEAMQMADGLYKYANHAIDGDENQILVYWMDDDDDDAEVVL
jgi:hypothetical protein